MTAKKKFYNKSNNPTKQERFKPSKDSAYIMGWSTPFHQELLSGRIPKAKSPGYTNDNRPDAKFRRAA